MFEARGEGGINSAVEPDALLGAAGNEEAVRSLQHVRVAVAHDRRERPCLQLIADQVTLHWMAACHWARLA